MRMHLSDNPGPCLVCPVEQLGEGGATYYELVGTALNSVLAAQC